MSSSFLDSLQSQCGHNCGCLEIYNDKNCSKIVTVNSIICSSLCVAVSVLWVIAYNILVNQGFLHRKKGFGLDLL